MADEVVTLIHHIELNIFKEFAHIANRHHINYLQWVAQCSVPFVTKALFHGMMTWMSGW